MMRPLLCAVLVVASACEQRPAPYQLAELHDDTAAHDPGLIVVDFIDGTTKADFDRIEAAWGVDLELNDAEEGVDSAITIGAVTPETDIAALLATIRKHPLVEVAEPLMHLSAPAERWAPPEVPREIASGGFRPNDPRYQEQWNLALIHMPETWEESRGKGVTVAVLDTGVAYENFEDFVRVPDLEKTRFVAGYDFVNDDAHANDDHGHGTHVAGTIAQSTDNGEGVAGVAFDATVMPVKVLDHFGSGNSADIADAIRWAADHGAKVINMSLGGGGRSEVMANAVAYARARGAVVVCAAGNGGRGVVEYPAAYPGSVAVAAVGPNAERAPYSSWGQELDVAAPGGDKRQGEQAGVLQNTINPQDPSQSVYAAYQGTSMATPHVAGVAALLWAAGAKTVDEVEAALMCSARQPSGERAWSDQLGHGLLDAKAALKALGDGVDGSCLKNAVAGAPSVSAFGPVEWKPLAWAAVLLAFVLLSLSKKERPGYLNVLLSPSVLAVLTVTTLGLLVFRAVAPSELTTSLVLPLPDWLNRIIFGRGSLANPLIYSALIPVVAALFGIKLKGARPAIGGLALGFAGILAYTAWANTPPLAWLPLKVMALPWLVVNTLVCLFIARAMLRKERA